MRATARRPPLHRAHRRRRAPPRASALENLIRAAVLGAIVVAAIWILFGTGPG